MRQVQSLTSPDDVTTWVAESWLLDIERRLRTTEGVNLLIAGGRSVHEVLKAANECTSRDLVDWRRVHIWWADERFLPSGDPDRNETGARNALLDHVDLVPDHVHVIPGPSRAEDDPDPIAREYWRRIRAAHISFDFTLLGMGPDGHVASLFPGHSALEEDSGVVALRDSPKPPSTRITLTAPALNRSNDIWFIVSGRDKASAVKSALTTVNRREFPASAIYGLQRTVWALDAEAASLLPSGVAQ